MRMTNWKTVAYWGVTVLFSGIMLLSAWLYLSGTASIRETLTGLGYPAYILLILGTAKLLGAIALIQSRWPTLREWAYAGFTVNFVGATASHLLAGDALGLAIVPAAFLVPLAVSYVLQPDRFFAISHLLESGQPGPSQVTMAP